MGSSSNTTKGGTDIVGGGSNAPWNWGTSPFDLQAISDAVGLNTSAVENRYNQLGLGGSTMEGQDVANVGTMGTALQGQEQTANMTNPALNPALQTPLNTLFGQSQAPSLGTLAGTALTLATKA